MNFEISKQDIKQNILRLTGVCVLPFLLLGFFNFPSADDYSYANIAIAKGFWQSQLHWYQAWSGRYIATALLSLSPVVYHWFLGYKFIGLVTFLLFMASSYVCISALLGPLVRKTAVRPLFWFFSVLYLCEMPSITEAFHWFPGVTNYTLALILFLLGVGYYIRSTGLAIAQGAKPDFNRHALRDSVVLSLVSFLLPGINESLVVVWLFLLALVFVAIFCRERKILFSLLAPGFFGAIGFYLVYKAPGNAIRAAEFTNNHDILFTVFRPLGLEIELFFRYLKPSVFLGLLLAIPFVRGLKPQIEPAVYTKKARWQVFAIYIVLGFLFLAPAHWAIGGAPARRAMNIYCYIHLVLLLMMFSQWIWAREDRALRLESWLGRYFPAKVQGAVFVLSLFAVSNIGVAWADLLFRANTYASEQAARVEQMAQAAKVEKMAQAPSQEVVFKPLTYQPETLFFSEVSEDPSYWINTAVSEYFKVKSVRLEK